VSADIWVAVAAVVVPIISAIIGDGMKTRTRMAVQDERQATMARQQAATDRAVRDLEQRQQLHERMMHPTQYPGTP
jgi:heme exporter protein D